MRITPRQDPAALSTCLRTGLADARGRKTVLAEGDLEWEDAILPYNTRLAGRVRPWAVVYPQDVEGIRTALGCARQADVPVVARSGGHSYGAYSLGGDVSPRPVPGTHPVGTSSSAPNDPHPIAGERSLVIDLRALRSITYDPATARVRVGPGALLGELNEALEARGRAIPSGSCPTVGVGGQAIAGGFGLTSRAYGLLLDNMEAAEVVLADGRMVTVSETENRDLFWAVRGAGSSFGIVHSLTFTTHPAPPNIIYFELSLLPRALPSSPAAIQRATDLFLAFQTFGASADMPKEMGMSWHVTPEPARGGGGTGPGEWGVKVEVLGQFSGTREEYERAMGRFEQRVRARGEEAFERGQRQLTYLESMHNVGGNWTRLVDRPWHNIHEHVNFYAKSLITKHDIPETSMHQHLTHLFSLAPRFNPSTAIEWFVLSPYLGGPNSAVTQKRGTAFAHRDLQVVWEMYAKRLDEGAGEGAVDLVGLVQGMMTGMETAEAVYPAYIDPELPASLYPRATWGDLYPKLQNLKARFDADNLFRSPQSVRPVMDRARSIQAAATESSDSLSGTWLPVIAILVLLGVVAKLAIDLRPLRRSRQKRRKE